MSDRADQLACTEAVLDVTPDAAVVANLGVASCLLATVDDERPANLYLWGSMGSTTAVGLGVALETDRPVTVLDGDGSTLMSLGTFGTVAECGQANLVVVVFDNATYATTGGQRSGADEVDIAGVARECGLRSERVATDAAFVEAYADAVSADEPAVVVCDVEDVRPDRYPPTDFPVLAHQFRDEVGGDST